MKAASAPLDMLRKFLRLEAIGGLLLFVAAMAGLVLANSPFSSYYCALLDTPMAIQIGALSINKPLILWINDGLMAIFFFLIGLEVKREILEGELSSPELVVLPSLAAFGAIMVPAAIYSWLNWNDPVAMAGWAVPCATDIAFALGVLSLFGKRIPSSLKVFLLTLAIFDDLAAIAIIAVFYVGDLSLLTLTIAGGILGCAVVANLLGVKKISVYVLIGIALWIAVLKSGVHATLAGVLIAACIPMKDADGPSPLNQMESDLHFPVAYVILPLFAFANAGLSLFDIGLQDLTHPVTLGIILGLVLGNPIGILLITGLGVILRVTRLPEGVNWLHMTGVSFICGIGFTMSLFISGLAFEHAGDAYYGLSKLGILIGSAIAGLMGVCILSLATRKSASQAAERASREQSTAEGSTVVGES